MHFTQKGHAIFLQNRIQSLLVFIKHKLLGFEVKHTIYLTT
jgi:hypothetical protein